MEVNAQYAYRSTGNYEGNDYDNLVFDVMGGRVKVRVSDLIHVPHLEEGDSVTLSYGETKLRKNQQTGYLVPTAQVEHVLTESSVKAAV